MRWWSVGFMQCDCRLCCCCVFMFFLGGVNGFVVCGFFFLVNVIVACSVGSF